mmetsp:Transcript_25157/g.57823  ORF Transcript_25157/g.57823 Transcript_25157/m.57823 type:complete len:217 (+) Transcript_25157:525-1175(+)
MHEVKAYVLGFHFDSTGTGLREYFAKTGEDRSGWRLCLYKPPMVERHLALHELDGCLLFLTQGLEGWQELGIFIHDVRQSDIMVLDSLAALKTMVLPVSNLRKQKIYLHHVMECSEAQQSSQTGPIHFHLAVGIVNQTCICQQKLEVSPLHLVPEGHPLVHARKPSLLCRLQGSRFPIAVNAKTKPINAIEVQAEEPIDGKKGAHGPLIFILSSSA